MSFDPDTFMQQTVDKENATSYRLVPEGTYKAMVDDFDSKAFRTLKWQDKDTGEDREAVLVGVPFNILDDAIKAQLGREKLIADMSMFLDFDATGALSVDPDKNVKLGQLKESLGQNKPGWNFSMLRGAGPVMVSVKHEVDKKDKEKKYARVVKVMPIR